MAFQGAFLDGTLVASLCTAIAQQEALRLRSGAFLAFSISLYTYTHLF